MTVVAGSFSRLCILLPSPLARAARLYLRSQGRRETASPERNDTSRKEEDWSVFPPNGLKTRVKSQTLSLSFLFPFLPFLFWGLLVEAEYTGTPISRN